MAFFTFLRIGEITVSKCDSFSSNLLQLGQVSTQCGQNGEVVSLVITFKNYKHNYNQNLFSIVLAKQLNACPARSFIDYLLLCGPLSGPLSINQEGLPVLRSDFCKMLCSIVQLCNLDPKKYKGHSFRILTLEPLLMQPSRVFLTRKLGNWVDGNLMPLKNTSE